MNRLYWVAFALTVIGGINWGLIGLLQIDLVAALFAPMSPLSRIVYTLVGISAVYILVVAVRNNRPKG